jgi:anaerobic selenocysteine-containing dehydrogenase
MNFLEISQEDADDRGIESGDLLLIESDRVLNQVGDEVRGEFDAVAYVTDAVPPGVTWAYFHYPGSHANSVVSGDTSLHPISLRYNFKLGRGRVSKVGTTDLVGKLSFAPRNLA